MTNKKFWQAVKTELDQIQGATCWVPSQHPALNHLLELAVNFGRPGRMPVEGKSVRVAVSSLGRVIVNVKGREFSSGFGRV